MAAIRWLASTFALLAAGPAVAAELTGRASVVDGDTIHIRGERIRLHGIDAPESGQVPGWLRRRLSLRPASSIRPGGPHRRSERPLRRSRPRPLRPARRPVLPRDTDLNRWMVRQGQAVAYRNYSTEYVPAESAARSERAGLWQGDFDVPWDWRRGDRRILEGGRPAAAAVDRGDCDGGGLRLIEAGSAPGSV